MHLLFGLPRRPCRILLVSLRMVVRLSAALYDAHSSLITTRPVWKDVHIDIASLVNRFDLNPYVRSYVCCPSCFSLYPDNTAPTLCSHRETPGSQSCAAKLWRSRTVKGKLRQRPILSYHHQDLILWLGRLFSRPDIEAHVEQLPRSRQPPQVVVDIMQSHAFSEFIGPGDRDAWYFDNSDDPTSARLAFALALDGFNPYHSKPAGPSITSTGIYMVLLNLPPHLRYLPENLYLVGVIPGKPSLNQINHFLKLLVDDLLPLWSPGIRLSRTAKHRHGRRCHAALIPLVADLLAARQTAGFGSHSMTQFCSCCRLTLDDIEDFSPSTWRPRNLEDHKRAAYLWRDAANTAEREQIFEDHGVRWSELLRLPYWDPIRFTAIDSMHNLYLGLLKDHCREIWGMDLDAPDGDGISHPRRDGPVLPDDSKMRMARQYLLHGTEQELRTHTTKSILWHLCAERGLRRAGTVKKLMRELMIWVRRLFHFLTWTCSSIALAPTGGP